MDPAWSETGDRYMLKLFRDYLFHQVDENGAPWVDMAHIIMCLNKVGTNSLYNAKYADLSNRPKQQWHPGCPFITLGTQNFECN